MVAKVGEMQDKIQKKLKAGYQKLAGFETSTKGYEWFGSAPGHEALTSYGISQFSEMKALNLSFVDDQMISRSAQWLMSRRKNDSSG